MTNAEHDDRPRNSRRRKQAIAGAVGLAAVLGGGAFLITDRLTGEADPVSSEVAAPAPVGAPAPGAASMSPVPSGPSAAPKPSATVASSASPSAPAASSPKPRTTAERIRDARAAVAKAGDQVRRPLPPVNGNAAPAASEVTVTNTGSLREGGTLRVVSARQDLTGHRELRWAADAGEAVGTARCTQNFRLSAGAPAKERPTMLLCWRTSAERSVYTIAVSADGRPSKAASVAVIDQRWAQLD